MKVMKQAASLSSNFVKYGLKRVCCHCSRSEKTSKLNTPLQDGLMGKQCIEKKPIGNE